ncbi:MBL fold metallo-hydrolase [Undibacterium sp. JH2W]|uniref:MBL fold metallo-hydrolase n=1 Tax=Undibacterium sp. JH2W TaxID=3413037 RepID=UPI003BF28A10
MKIDFKPGYSLFLSLLLCACAQTSHPEMPAQMGRPTSSIAMEALIDAPGPIQLETINSAEWKVPLAGLVNLKSPAAIAAKLEDRDEAIQVYVHVIKHPQFGNFLVDTGVSAQLLKNPDEVGLSWMVRKFMHLEKMQLKTNTAEVVQGLHSKLSGVFFTHLHLDHVSGMPDIPADVPLYIGQDEASHKDAINLFVHGSTNALLKGKHSLQVWSFADDPQNQFEGIFDIFSDGSVFAISVPGHTAGSVAYLIRTTSGPVLLTGDTCHTRWGWENTVEPGDFTRDNKHNLENLKKLKQLVARHPLIQVRFGHQL